MSINVYTDGSCMPNPGFGGWAYTFIDSSNRCDLWFSHYGRSNEKKTTNNKMEMQALIEFLKDAATGERYIIHSDSGYTLGGLIKGGKSGNLIKPGKYTGWMQGWKRGGWEKPAKNKELWKQLDRECKRHVRDGSELCFQWVKAHNGDEGNEYVDKLAKKGAMRAKRKFK